MIPGEKSDQRGVKKERNFLEAGCLKDGTRDRI